MKMSGRGVRFGGAVAVTVCAEGSRGVGGTTISVAAMLLALLAILSSSGCVGLTSSFKPASGQQSGAGAKITVVPSSIAFGSVALGTTSSQSVVISNESGLNVEITRATTTAAGVKIAGISLPLVIGAGKQATFDVVYSPKVAGALSANVSILSNASKTPSTISLRGVATAATSLLTTSTSNLQFGNVAIGQSGTLSVTLTNSGNSNVTVSKVTVLGASYSTSGVSPGLVLAPGQSAKLDAKFNPVTKGPFAGSVSVISTATNSPATISLLGGAAGDDGHSVTLGWIPSASVVAGYNVYRSETSGGPYSKLDMVLVAANQYVDATVRAELTYYYVITAVSFAGAESADSAQASATIPDD
jgi:hypothetical protein